VTLFSPNAEHFCADLWERVNLVGALSLTPEGQPMRIKMAPVPGFTRKAIAAWATDDLPGVQSGV
jgi:hypothetical protein